MVTCPDYVKMLKGLCFSLLRSIVKFESIDPNAKTNCCLTKKTKPSFSVNIRKR